MELTQNFWKFASKSNAVDSIENIFIKWAGEVKLSIDEFNSIYAEVNNQINDYFGKTANIRIDSDGSVSGPAEEVQQYIEKLQQQEQNNIPQETDLNENIPVEDTMPISEEPAPAIAEEPIAEDTPEQPMETPIEQEDMSTDSMNKTSISSSEPNAEIQEEPMEEDNQFPLLDILGS